MNELEFNTPTYLQFLASTTRISMISSKILRQADLFAELQLANRLAAQTAGGDGELSLDEGEGGGGNTTAKSRALHGEEERLSKENKDVVAKTVGRFASSGVTRTTLFPTQRMVTNENGAPVFEPSLSSAKGKKVAMEKDEANIKKIMGDLNMMNGISESLPTDKKHRKGKKNVKQRTKWTADDY